MKTILVIVLLMLAGCGRESDHFSQNTSPPPVSVKNIQCPEGTLSKENAWTGSVDCIALPSIANQSCTTYSDGTCSEGCVLHCEMVISCECIPK